jgi:TrmH family RNA methyltransferase
MEKILIGAENDEYQIIQSLKLNRTKRSKAGEIFIEGTECIKQALKADLEITRFVFACGVALSDWAVQVMESYPQARIIAMAGELFRTLCDRTDTPELLATARVRIETLSDLGLPENPLILVFDRPGDFGNLGAVIRSANAFGADALVIAGHGADAYEPKVIRASLGSVFHTRVLHAESLAELADFIAAEKAKTGMCVVGTDSGGTLLLGKAAIKRPVMLILGNEAKGMSRGLRDLADEIAAIPIGGAVNSLNVACAASILLWEIYKNSR